MATARSFSYSCPSCALQSPHWRFGGSRLLRERRPDYQVLDLQSQSDDPDPLQASFPAAPDVVQIYFDDAIRNRPLRLLSHAEEIQLAKAIEKGRQAAEHLASRRSFNGRQSALEELVRRGEDAHQQLITANLRLVVTVADWYRDSSIPRADLIQEGNIGLIQAAAKYDWRRGTRFSTYAVWWIRQTISRSLANDSRLIRVPVHAHQKLAMIARSRRDLFQGTGTDPSLEDIAEHTGLPEAQVRRLLPHLASPASLDAPIETTGDDVTDLAATATHPDALSTEDQVAQALAHEALERALSALTPREEQLLARRYGLGGRDHLSLRAAGEAFGLSKGQAQALEAHAMAKLRKHARGDGMGGFT